MNEHRVVHRLDQALKQLLAVLQPRAALLEIFQQFVDRGTRAAPSASGLPSSPMRPAAPASRVSCDIWLRKFADGALLAPLPDEEHTDAHG